LSSLIQKLRLEAHYLQWRVRVFFLMTKAATVPLAWHLANSFPEAYDEGLTPDEAVSEELSYWREDA
jgi:hypothetical protein